MQTRMVVKTFAAMAIFIVSVGVSAVPVVRTLNNVTFNDGGTATGSFSFDAATNTFSNVSIATTNGSARTGANYAFVSNGVAPSSSGALVVTTSAANQTGLPGLALFFAPPLSASGGGANVSGQEGNCADAGCTGPTPPQRSIAAGTVSAVGAAPALIPTMSPWGLAWLIALLGLVATGALNLQRLKQRR